MNKTILLILIIGILYRLFLTSGGNFIFNMDNARDFIDVREMVSLHKLRLTGPTSAIEGLYNGPLWYYLLAVPYIITGGDPYSAIVMEIVLWAVGGFFLLNLIRNFSIWLVIPIGLVWIASNYIVLATLYSFNPNPVTLLTPVFIYGLVEYLKGKRLWIVIVWFLAGAFFNFEMNVGIFTPLIVFISLFIFNKKSFFDKYFWIGILIFTLALLPQLLFDLKHNFNMSKAVINFVTVNKGIGLNFPGRINTIWNSYYNVFQGTMFNQKTLSWAILFLSLPILGVFLLKVKKNIIISTTILFILIPFTGYLILPVTVNPWHLGGFASASLILIAFVIHRLWKINFLGKITTVILFIALVFFPLKEITKFFTHDIFTSSSDPSVLKNEVAAIDYVYQYAKGQNFQVYTYLPSVYDYPYQYLIWWHGMKKFGYLPSEYSYAPNKPEYIPGKAFFSASMNDLKLRSDSNLVFLIKEPNRNYTRFGWEGDFVKMESIHKQMVGPIEVEVRKEIKR